MAPAFVSGASAVSTRTPFTGATLQKCTSARPAPALTMSANPMSRRQALLAGAALLAGVPLSAFAKSGEGPKISVFGVGGASSPFDAGIKRSGSILYSKFNADELAVFKRISTESKDRIVGAADSIKAKSWEDVRSRMRLEATELRYVQQKINASLGDDGVEAVQASNRLKLDLEKMDQACVQKNQDKTYKHYNAVLKDLDAWATAAGI